MNKGFEDFNLRIQTSIEGYYDYARMEKKCLLR